MVGKVELPPVAGTPAAALQDLLLLMQGPVALPLLQLLLLLV